MFDLSQINEEYLAKLKYDSHSRYEGWAMADIFGHIISENGRLAGSDFYAVCRRFSHRFIGGYLEIRMPDYSIIVYKIGIGNDSLRSKSFSFNIHQLDSIFSS